MFNLIGLGKTFCYTPWNPITTKKTRRNWIKRDKILSGPVKSYQTPSNSAQLSFHEKKRTRRNLFEPVENPSATLSNQAATHKKEAIAHQAATHKKEAIAHQAATHKKEAIAHQAKPSPKVEKTTNWGKKISFFAVCQRKRRRNEKTDLHYTGNGLKKKISESFCECLFSASRVICRQACRLSSCFTPPPTTPPPPVHHFALRATTKWFVDWSTGR